MMNNHDFKKFIRFIIAGGMNTLFGLSAYSLLIVLHFKLWSALLLATAMAIFFNFFTVSVYTFRDLSVDRFPRYFLGYGITYTLNLMSLQKMESWVGDPILAQAILALPVSLVSYVLISRLVFAGKK